jgi:hypothetical protein
MTNQDRLHPRERGARIVTGPHLGPMLVGVMRSAVDRGTGRVSLPAIGAPEAPVRHSPVTSPVVEG